MLVFQFVSPFVHDCLSRFQICPWVLEAYDKGSRLRQHCCAESEKHVQFGVRIMQAVHRFTICDETDIIYCGRRISGRPGGFRSRRCGTAGPVAFRTIAFAVHGVARISEELAPRWNQTAARIYHPHTQLHAYTCTHMNSYTHTHAHMHIHMHMNTCTHADVHTHTRTHADAHAHAHTHTHGHAHAHAHTHTHPHIHTCTHCSHTHMHTHTRCWICWWYLSLCLCLLCFIARNERQNISQCR